MWAKMRWKWRPVGKIVFGFGSVGLSNCSIVQVGQVGPVAVPNPQLQEQEEDTWELNRRCGGGAISCAQQ